MSLPFEASYKAYSSQRAKAAMRGIAWNFTFQQWCDVWEESGKWHLRGRGAGRYCMARPGDTGPYEKGNVSIVDWQTNTRDAGLNRPEQTRASGRAHLGTGRGWTPNPKSKKNPYAVQAGRRYIGCFPTQAEAEMAYRAACIAHRIARGE